MRKSYVQDPVTGKLIPKDEYCDSKFSGAPYIIPDINPYKSMVDGSMVMGRAQHREHLKRHNVVEVGNSFDNAKPKPINTPGGLKDQLIRAVNERWR